MFVIKETDEGQKAYKALSIKPGGFSVLNSELAQRILSELSKQPMCAMDISRKLGEHEQKIYYHLRRLEAAGIVKLDRTEERVGATAKIYSVSHPFLAIKLFEGDPISDIRTRAREIEFFKPLIREGKLDATIVVGSPDPHGKYGAQALDGSAGIDLALFIGTFLKSSGSSYKLDTEVTDKEMKGNLILIGGPKTNILIERFNKDMPIYFDTSHGFNLVSGLTKSVYSSDDIGIIVKIKNPLAKDDKHIIVLSGIRFKGTKASILALVNHMKDVQTGNKFGNGVARVVRGIDKDSDGRIDDVEFLE